MSTSRRSCHGSRAASGEDAECTSDARSRRARKVARSMPIKPAFLLTRLALSRHRLPPHGVPPHHRAPPRRRQPLRGRLTRPSRVGLRRPPVDRLSLPRLQPRRLGLLRTPTTGRAPPDLRLPSRDTARAAPSRASRRTVMPSSNARSRAQYPRSGRGGTADVGWPRAVPEEADGGVWQGDERRRQPDGAQGGAVGRARHRERIGRVGGEGGGGGAR